MPVPTGPQFSLYHGTGGSIEGDIIYPGYRQIHGAGAYASKSKEEAATYAEWKAEKEGRLFGTVYEVKPYDDEGSTLHDTDIFSMMRDERGFRVKGIVSYPLNTEVANYA
jgi:hypothetical protein